MKKISILSLAVLLAAGTSFAERYTTVGKIAIGDTKKEVSRQQLSLPLAAEEIHGLNAVRKAPKKTPIAADEVSGQYKWLNYTLLGTQDRPQLPDATVFSIELKDASSGLVEITGLCPGYDLSAIGVVDMEEGTLSIPNNQLVGEDEYGPLYFYVKPVKIVGNNGELLPGVADVEATVGYFNGDSFVFDPNEVWALGDPEYDDAFLFLTAENVLSRIDEEQEGQWETVGMCTIVDSWVTPAFRYDDGTPDGYQANPADYPFTAELQRHVDNENLYRVWRPYHSADWMFASFNYSEYNGQIVIDVTDPEHVDVKAGYFAGFGDEGEEFCVFGILGWQIYMYGDLWDPSYLPEVIAFMEQNDMAFDTFKDNVLTVNMSLFDTNILCLNPVAWNAYNVSTITFPDVNAVSNVGVEDTAVKYYNIQGVEVSNPAPGQIVICRQGDKVSKKIIK